MLNIYNFILAFLSSEKILEIFYKNRLANSHFFFNDLLSHDIFDDSIF